MNNWDARGKAQEYLRLANAIHPEEGYQYVSQLALQDFYYECYMASFSREKFLEFLNGAVSGSIKTPEEIDKLQYEEAFKQAAEKEMKKVSVG